MSQVSGGEQETASKVWSPGGGGGGQKELYCFLGLPQGSPIDRVQMRGTALAKQEFYVGSERSTREA